jgi:hypothetical protein
MFGVGQYRSFLPGLFIDPSVPEEGMVANEETRAD